MLIKNKFSKYQRKRAFCNWAKKIKWKQESLILNFIWNVQYQRSIKTKVDDGRRWDQRGS